MQAGVTEIDENDADFSDFIGIIDTSGLSSRPKKTDQETLKNIKRS